MGKFYGVVGGKDGNKIYETWEACQLATKNRSGVKYKGFPVRAEAEAYIRSLTSAFVAVDAPAPVVDGDIHVYTDGSCPDNNGDCEYAGFGLNFTRGDVPFKYKRFTVTGPKKTNNRAELSAVVMAVELCLEYLLPHPQRKLWIHIDSEYSMNGCIDWRHAWKAKGWKNSKGETPANLDLWQKVDELLNYVPGQVCFKKVLAHSGIPDNEIADRLAEEGWSMIANRRAQDRQQSE